MEKTLRDERIIGRQGYGLIQLNTGNGKGKSTAAIGQMVRACGAGKKVGLVYFDKGGDTHYSERAPLTQLGVKITVTGRDRIDPKTGRFDFSIVNEDKAEALRGLAAVEALFAQGYDLVVLDEVLSSAHLGMVPIDQLLALLEKKPKTTEVILTGRNAPEKLVEMAHLVTEMKLHKHYFYSGVNARKGLDF
jgi:cob(I)alamin adenosyltransferase